MRKLSLALILLLTGCGNVRCPYGRPAAYRYIILSGDISRYHEEWAQAFAGKAKRDAVFVVTHGGDNGKWIAGSGLFPDEPMGKFARRVKAENGYRQLVLISCNKGGYTLDVPDVWYAKKLVSSRPGRGAKAWARTPDDFVYSGTE